MAFDTLRQHAQALGGLKKLDGKKLEPIDDAAQRTVSSLIGAPLPAALRWWFSTYGGGIKFAEPVVYVDPREQVDVVLGHFLDTEEIRRTLDDFEGAMAPHRIPIHDDELGNFLAFDTGAITTR
jgi:hypothetical protein